jgi:hypothetical protein
LPLVTLLLEAGRTREQKRQLADGVYVAQYAEREQKEREQKEASQKQEQPMRAARMSEVRRSGC